MRIHRHRRARRAPIDRSSPGLPFMRPNVVDLFAGGGGASKGIELGGGFVAVAINHDEGAVMMHAANHTTTEHFCKSVYDVPPFRPGNRPVDLLWASPDCKHHSRAKGGKPCDKGIRDLAWVVVDWARAVLPTVIALENVPEFVGWGPLHPHDHPNPKLRDRPIRDRAGETFREFVSALEQLGYRVDWRKLTASDFGAPTSRERLYLVARRDGQAPQWPEPSHGPGRDLPHRTAAEIIDWTLPALSIFASPKEARTWAKNVGADGTPKRPLAEKTLRRIATGIRKFVLDHPSPFIVRIGHADDSGKVHGIERPLSTVTTKNEHILVTPTLIQTGYGERKGQKPRVMDIRRPLTTVVAGGGKHNVACAHLVKMYGTSDGADVRRPMPTVTATGNHLWVAEAQGIRVTAPWIAKHYTGVTGLDAERPLGTVTAIDHHAVVESELCPIDMLSPWQLAGATRVAAFLLKYYGEGSQWSDVGEPLHTVVTKARHALVEVVFDGDTYVIVDITMRMLTPRELARAQGFPDSYILTGTKENQIARIGNSVCPPVAEAIYRANMARPQARRRFGRRAA